jgi:uncharacterized protein (TIGR02001 family)
LQSDYRFRGYSISGEKPAAILSLSYDHPSGFYLNGSAIGSLGPNDQAVLLGAIGNAGYARRVGAGLSLDAGVTRTQYYHDVASTTGNAHYTEFYVGVLAHGLSAHLYVSPDYFRSGNTTLYGEVDGALKPIHGFQLTGHVGVLGYLATSSPNPRGTQYDWQAGLAHRLGPFDLHAAVTGGGPASDYYYGRAHGKTAVVGGVSWIF